MILTSEPQLSTLQVTTDTMNDAPIHYLPLLERNILSSSSLPSSTQSYGWADFPCQGDDPMQCIVGSSAGKNPFSVSSPSSSSCTLGTTMSLAAIDHEGEMSYHAGKRHFPPSPRSACSIHVFDTMPTDVETTANNNKGREMKEKQVSFSPWIAVRTHSIVLGDHPCCTSGMALTCGWESADAWVPITPNNHYQLPRTDSDDDDDTDVFCCQPYNNATTTNHRRRRRMMELHLSYAVRRERLQEVTGLTGSQLLWEEYRLACTMSSNSPSMHPLLQSSPTTTTTTNALNTNF